jgi:Recombinase
MRKRKNNGRKIRSIQKRENNNLIRSYMEFPKDENGVLYVRQSSIAQMQNNIHSFEMQTDKFVEHFRNRGCTGHIEIVADDEGLSGTMDIHEMPGLTYVMELIEGKKLLKGKQIRWVGAIDVKRLTRDKWLVKPGTLMRACYENDVWISTLRMDFNFQDDYCQRVFMLEAEEAARHLDWMKLVMGGKAIASDNGYYDGRWLAPGYIVDRSDEKRKKYVIYEPHAKVVRWLFRRFLELDGNIWELCREVERMPFLFPKFEDWVDPKSVNKFAATGRKKSSLIKEGPYAGNYRFTVSGIRYILCNPVYIGWWLPINGGVVENNHEAIVDEVLFTYAHKRLSSYNLNGERQKPERVTRSGEAKAILKKVLRDDKNQPMYTTTSGKKSWHYDSHEHSGLSITHRYSLSV